MYWYCANMSGVPMPLRCARHSRCQSIRVYQGCQWVTEEGWRLGANWGISLTWRSTLTITQLHSRGFILKLTHAIPEVLSSNEIVRSDSSPERFPPSTHSLHLTELFVSGLPLLSLYHPRGPHMESKLPVPSFHGDHMTESRWWCWNISVTSSECSFNNTCKPPSPLVPPYSMYIKPLDT